MSPGTRVPDPAAGPMRLVMTTFPTRAVATRISRSALNRHLAACVNFSRIDSTYHWKGAVESANEILAIFKTTPGRVGRLFAFIQKAHPYDVPEIIEVDVPRVSEPYLRYLIETVEPTAERSNRRRPRAKRRE